MASLQHSKVTNALHVLKKVPDTRTAEILENKLPSENAKVERDDERDSKSPTFDRFCSQGDMMKF